MNISVALIEVAGLWLLASSVFLVRHQLMSIRYGLGWIVASLCGLAAGPVILLLQSAVRRAGFTPTGFSLGIFIAFLGLVGIQLSISVSGHYRAIQNLTEHAAMLEQRVAELEARGVPVDLAGGER